MDQEKYVSKGEVKPYTELFDSVFGKIKKVLKKKQGLTFTHNLVGSAKRNLVVRHHNQGFDCDYQLYLQKNKKDLSPKEIKQLLIDEFDKRMPAHGFDKCENKTTAIKIKKKNTRKSAIEFSYDVVIMKNDNGGPQVIKESNPDVYVWNKVADYGTWAEDYAKIKGSEMWGDLRDRYYEKKIKKAEGDASYQGRKSFQILHEATKETISSVVNK